jgi:hypothetical protein
MKILKSPQISNNIVEYAFNGDVITATLNGKVDTFDFSSMPNSSMTTSIKTTLDCQVVTKAERDADGVLKVVVYNPISVDATEAERFPVWEEA